MPLKTPEEKKNALKWMFNQLKVFGATAAVALASVWGVAEVYLEDYVKETVNKVIEEKGSNKSFREVLGEEMGVPTDMVPYHIVDRFDQVDTLSMKIFRFETKYVEHLEFQLHITPIYCFVDENGIEWWMGPDGHPHGVMYENDRKWVVYHGTKVYI